MIYKKLTLMKNFDERPLDEKLNIILEDHDFEDIHWSKGLKAKVLLLLPLLTFIVFWMIFSVNTLTVNTLILMIIPFICIPLGVYLYSFMIK